MEVCFAIFRCQWNCAGDTFLSFMQNASGQFSNKARVFSSLNHKSKIELEMLLK